VADRLRVAFQAAGVVISGHQIGATVSIGIATAIGAVPLDPMLARADAALYRAKHNGRNRIEFDDAEPAKASSPQPIPSFGQALAAAH
jgi:PleD family two-component response regulator